MSSKETELAKKLKNQMLFLAQYKGRVTVLYFDKHFTKGDFQPIEGELKEFVPKSNVALLVNDGNSSIPLLGNGCAVKEITDMDGNVLYRNTLVNVTYPDNYEDIRKKCGFE